VVDSTLRTRGSDCLFSKRFHVLLNSLFKVLFNFRSRYLFTISLLVIFSLSRSLPATLGCTHKQPDSKENIRRHFKSYVRVYHPLRSYVPVDFVQVYSTGGHLPNTTFQSTQRAPGSVMGYSHFIRHYYRNQSSFLFLRSMICLSSAGNLI
jgi:hypothetical protein